MDEHINFEDQIRIAEEGIRLTKIIESSRKRDEFGPAVYFRRESEFEEFQKYFEQKAKSAKAQMEKGNVYRFNKLRNLLNKIR